jgi:hypothetical protein
VGVHAAAGVRLERLGHEAGDQTLTPGQGPRYVSYSLEVVGSLDWIGVADVDLDLPRAIFGGNLFDLDVHRLEGVADVVEEIGTGFETVESKHAAWIGRSCFPGSVEAKKIALRLKCRPRREPELSQCVDLTLQLPARVAFPGFPLLLPHPAEDTAGGGKERQRGIGVRVSHGKEVTAIGAEDRLGGTEVEHVVAQIGAGECDPLAHRLLKAGAGERLALRAPVVITVRNPEMLDSVRRETVEKLLLRRFVARGHVCSLRVR